jgi:hypothetical protein
VALSVGTDDGKVIVTELIGRERWVRLMERVEGTRDWTVSLVLKFLRRELGVLRQIERGVHLIGGGGDIEPRAGEMSDGSSSSEDE